MVDGRAIHPQLLQLLRGVELSPEIEGDVRRGGPRTGQHPIDEPEQGAGEVLRLQPFDGGELAFDNPVLQIRIRDDRVDQRRDVDRIAVLEQDARAVLDIGD